jgi:pimeloyl-ACP methyl ester carboxylesterase
MVALEVAALLKPKAVILVGSCATPKGLAPHLRALGRLALTFPAAAFRPRQSFSPVLLPKFGQLNREQKAVFWAMAAAVPASFLKWACGAVPSWRPTPSNILVFHIHGDRDRLIPIDRVRPTDVVAGGGHLVRLTHPAEVTAFLRRVAEPVA